MHCNFRLSLVFLAILGLVTAGCALAGPTAPAVPATPPTPAAPSTLPTPTTPSTPPATQQATPPTSLILPAINYFLTTSNTVPPNALVILVWSVSGADSVSIDNGIGKVKAQGRYGFIPATSATYTLTAINAAGGVTAQVAVSVSELQAASPHYFPGYSTSHVGQDVVAGSTITISLDTQTSRGYKWVVDYYDTTMVSYVSSNYIPKNPLTRGVDGQQQFTFKPLKVGDTRILVSNVNEQKPTQFDSIIYDIHIKQR